MTKGQREVAGPSTHADAPPSYEAISTARARQSNGGHANSPGNEQRSEDPGFCSTSNPGHRPFQSNPWSRTLKSSPSPHTTKEVRKTVLALVRNLVLNAESPDLLDSCANACRTYHLDFSALLQEPFIEHHSAMYWAIVKGCDALLPSLLACAAPLSQDAIFEIRVACLVTGNQQLFQSLRCKSKSDMTPLSTCHGTHALLLGSMPADEVSIREMGDQGEFIADMRINLWQKRLRVSSKVVVEFIARSRLWCLTFYSPPSSPVLGPWQVALQLQEPSPPTFIDSKLMIEPPSSTSGANAFRADDLISLSPASDCRPAQSSPSSNSLHSCKRKAPQTIELRLSTAHLLSWRNSTNVQQWTDGDKTCTNGIIVPLDNSVGTQLLYDNTPFLATDGTLRARLEVRLEKPGVTN